ncbi:MAG: HlyD family type I secretion periplasmic adaptor subunit [Alphaproteobacteria bacterium]
MRDCLTGSKRSIRRNVRAGLGVALLLVGSVGAWAFSTNISGAVIAPGSLVVDSNVRKVQHPTGGVIGEILIRDGDRVQAGNVLVRLDATTTRANLAMVSKSLDELRARKARLEAERDDGQSVEFPKELTSRATDTNVAALMAGEQKLFDLRRSAQTGQKSQLRQRIVQLKQEVEGLSAQATAKAQEIELIKTELKGVRDLWGKQLTPITKLTHLEREATRLDGERAQLIAASAQAKGKITETELQIVQVDRAFVSEVAKELRDIDAKIGEFLERKITAEDQLKRIDIRAPIDGIVHRSTAHTVGGVITASGEPIMLIVPESDRLVVEAKVSPTDIDQLHVGQQALLRFQTFNRRTTPELNGVVNRISADAMKDQHTGATYYTIRVVLDTEEVARLGEIKLVPGMPVETFIRTADRKVISYLLKPLKDQTARAFRER